MTEELIDLEQNEQPTAETSAEPVAMGSDPDVESEVQEEDDEEIIGESDSNANSDSGEEEEEEDSGDEDSDVDDDVEDDEEEEESGKPTTQSSAQETVKKTSAPPDDNGEYANLTDELYAKIKHDYVPGTKLFREAVRKEARAQVSKEFGADYDQFDEEHQAAYMDAYSNIAAQRKQEFDNAVEIVKLQRQQREFWNHTAQEIESVLTTPELQNELAEALDGVSVRYYKSIQQELQQGKTDKLMKLVNNVASKRGLKRAVTRKASPAYHKATQGKKRKSNNYASSLVFGI